MDFASLALDEQVAYVLAAWRSSIPRLLIFDNCEDEALLDAVAANRPAAAAC